MLSPETATQNLPKPEITNGYGDILKRAAGRVGLCLALSVSLLAAAEVEPESAHATGEPTAMVGMPFTGKWAYDSLVYPDNNGNYDDSSSSHPSVHHRFYGDWATDLYAPATTAVKLHTTSSDGPVTYTLNHFYDSCSSAGPNIAGHGIVLNVLVNGKDVGSIDYEHLDNIPSSGPYTDGMTIGEITSEPLDISGGCYTARHTHIELKNAGPTYSCWTDKGYPGQYILPEGDTIGELGSSNTGPQQKCADISSPPSNGINFRPAVIQRSSGETDVAAVGPGNSLAFYYNAAGSPNWGGGVIPNSQAYSTPAIVQRPSGETDIAVEGPNNSLLFYFNAQGSNTWGKITIPGAVAYSAPAIVQRASGETDIAVRGANNALAFYYNAAGSPNWGGGVIPSTQAYGEPAMIQRPTGETDIAVQGSGNDMNMYFNAPGSNSWGTSAVAAPGWALSAPSIIQRSTGETDIAVQGPGNSLDFYINAQGSGAWGRIPAQGGGTTFNAPNPPAMRLRSTGEVDIAVEGPGNQADLYFNAQGSPNWGESTAAVGGYSLRAPAMIQRPGTGETDMVIVGPSNRLDFYFNAQGSPHWSNTAIAGNNSAS